MLTIYVAIILGLFFPYGSIMKPYLNYILSVLVFFSFIKVEFKLSTFLRKELLIIALVLWGIIPFIVFWATYYLNPEVHLGLFLLSATPPAIASVVVISLIKGDLGLGIVTSVLFNVLSPLSYSVLLSIYFSQSGVDLPIQKIFISLFLIIFIPLTLIFLIQKYAKNLEKTLVRVSSKASIWIWSLFILFAVSGSRDGFIHSTWSNIALNFAMVFSLAVFNFTMGYFTFKDTFRRKTSMACIGQKNTLLAVGLASQFFPKVTILVVLYIISHHLINGVILGVFSEKKTAED